MQNRNHYDDGTPNNSKKSAPLHLLAFAMVALLVVLVLVYLPAILRPLKVLNSVLTPITIGLVIAYLANPLLRLFEYKAFSKIKNRRANRALSLFCSYLVIFSLLAAFIWLIIPKIVESMNDLRVNGLRYVDNIIISVNERLSAIPFLEDSSEDLISLEKFLNYMLDWLNRGSSLLESIGNVASSMLNALKNILVGFFVSIYVLLSKARLNASCRRIFRAFLSPKKEQWLLYYLGKAHRKFGGFFIGKILESFLFGFLCAAVFAIFKIPYVTLVAVLIGATNIIPFFGPFIGAIPSGMLIFIKDPMKALLFTILIVLLQQLNGNLFRPLILGDSTGLSSLGVLVAITLCSGLFGITGLLIGVPLFALLLAMAEDWIALKLHKKGESATIEDYYPTDAFLKPRERTEGDPTLKDRFACWISSVETEVSGVDFAPSIHHSIGRFFRFGLLRICRYFRKLPRIANENQEKAGGETQNEPTVSILPQEPEPPELSALDDSEPRLVQCEIDFNAPQMIDASAADDRAEADMSENTPDQSE